MGLIRKVNFKYKKECDNQSNLNTEDSYKFTINIFYLT
jgi:hypothetical protein